MANAPKQPAETMVAPPAADQATVTADADANTIAAAGPSTYLRTAVGSKLGVYTLERKLGAGGMGEVFAARKPGGPLVALKVLADIHATRLYRFKREFRAIADVEHENLIALDELVVLPNGQAFFTMELVEGVEFNTYVRGQVPPGQLPNLVRLRRVMRQLVEGVDALHRARCVHRDIKPSNVLVTREGRVVILDFGVISEQSEDEGVTRDGQMMGTPAYMAPEQAGGQVAGPPADYYAIGGILFECLTGTLPFTGSVLDILLEKRHGDVPKPGPRLDPSVTHTPELEALFELCTQAMAPEPEDRPDGPGFLAALGDSHRGGGGRSIRDAGPGLGPSESSANAARLGESGAPFVGRRRELEVLDGALEVVQGQLSPVAVHICGPSGQGKSALVSHFLHQARRVGELVVLRGRCLERESVPYKGLDAVVDALSIHLRRLEPIEQARLQPRHVAPLLQLFPVLAGAWQDQVRLINLDPGELRRRGLAALREVLGRLGESRPLIVYVDDFQWADVDSARVIAELMRPPDPPAMLLVVTFRDEVDEREVLQLLTSEARSSGGDVREITLGPLSDAEASELASKLMRGHSASAAGQPSEGEASETQTAEAYARRAKGNPFYIGQMVLGADDAHTSSDASLDRLVARRIVGLDAAQRKVLATVAVAGGPTPLAVVLRACGEAFEESELDTVNEGEELAVPAAGIEDSPEVEALLGANLLHRHPDREGVVRIETAHDRIRVVAVGELSPQELRETHLAIADAFEALGGGESEALAEHFSLAGDMARALYYTELAAKDAARALAFERTAELLRRALTLVEGSDHDHRRELEQALAEQLVNLGRGAEAAAMFTSLAADTREPRRARDLRRRAASELIKAGYLDEGMDTIAPVLGEIGLWQPTSVLGSILGTIWNRILLGFRGYRFRPRAESEVPAKLLERIDTFLATKTGLSHHEAIFAGYQQSRAMRLALRAGEGRRLIRCLIHDAAIWVALGRKAKGQALMAKAREIVQSIEEPEYHRVIEYVEANHRDHSGDWVGAAAAFEALQARLDESPNSGWIRGASTAQWMYVRKLLGRWALLRDELPERVATARDLGVRHEHISLSALWALTEAIYGDPEAARQRLVSLREQWQTRQVTFQTILLAMMEVEVALLAGEPQRAIEAADAVLGNTKARIVAEMMPSHVDFYELQGRARVRAALEGVDVARSLELVAKDLARLGKSHKPQIAAQAVTIEAALRSCEGQHEAALAAWRDAAERCEAISMDAHLAAVRVRLGEAGDSEAAAAAQRYFEDQGIGAWRAFADALAPGKVP